MVKLTHKALTITIFPLLFAQPLLAIEVAQERQSVGKDFGGKEKVDDSILIAQTNWEVGLRKAKFAVYNWAAAKKISAIAMIRYVKFLQNHPNTVAESFDAKEQSGTLAKLEKTASEPSLISEELRVNELSQSEIAREKVLQRIYDSEIHFLTAAETTTDTSWPPYSEFAGELTLLTRIFERAEFMRSIAAALDTFGFSLERTTAMETNGKVATVSQLAGYDQATLGAIRRAIGDMDQAQNEIEGIVMSRVAYNNERKRIGQSGEFSKEGTYVLMKSDFANNCAKIRSNLLLAGNDLLNAADSVYGKIGQRIERQAKIPQNEPNRQVLVAQLAAISLEASNLRRSIVSSKANLEHSLQRFESLQMEP